MIIATSYFCILIMFLHIQGHQKDILFILVNSFIFCIASQRKVNHWYSEQNLKWEIYRYNYVPIGYYATMKRTLTMPLWWKIHIHILLSSHVIVSYSNNLQQETCKKWKVNQCWGRQDHHNWWIQFWLWSAWLCSGKIDKHLNLTVVCVWIQIWNRI